MVVTADGKSRPRREPDTFVRAFVTCLNWLRWLVPYEWAAAIRFARTKRGLPQSFVAFYTTAWVASLALIFSFVPTIRGWGDWAAWLGAGVAVWCIFEVTRWWLSVLLDRRHNHFVSFERNLVFLFVNLTQVVLGGAVLLRMTSPGFDAERALFDSFFLTTRLSNAPHASALHDAAQGITALASLVLLAGGLAILVGGMARFFSEGEYEGPWRLPSFRNPTDVTRRY